MTDLAWLEDGREESLRSAMAACVPELASLPVRMNPWHAASNPRWWSSSAVVDDRFIVKFAWSELCAIRLWREGRVLERLRANDPSLALPEVVAVSRAPALLVTRKLAGEPLSWEWASSLGEETTEVASQIASFLVRLHGVVAGDVTRDLPAVIPTAQADTEILRRRFPLLVDDERGAWVLRRCDWVDDVLGAHSAADPGVLVHGDLHGYNQLWDRASVSLVAVVDFESSGVADRHFDLRYLPGSSAGPQLVLAVMAAYERRSGIHLSIDRVMAWHVLTALGDALWRTEAGVALPGGGTATTYVDRLATQLSALDLD